MASLSFSLRKDSCPQALSHTCFQIQRHPLGYTVLPRCHRRLRCMSFLLPRQVPPMRGPCCCSLPTLAWHLSLPVCRAHAWRPRRLCIAGCTRRALHDGRLRGRGRMGSRDLTAPRPFAVCQALRRRPCARLHVLLRFPHIVSGSIFSSYG